ncbi:MAG: thioesterase family protein [Ardenticatenaceae bacterium]|nr:thioesterase family protein [Ardenticatenaceae bacterium]
MHELFEEHIPFNKELGLKIEQLGTEGVVLRFKMADKYVGNPVKGILHGGITSSLLDVAGGVAAGFQAFMRLDDHGLESLMQPIGRLGTIDLRVDFLRPGVGQEFVASATVMRAGRTVAVTRMELHNEEGTLIAVGTGAYVVG